MRHIPELLFLLIFVIAVTNGSVAGVTFDFTGSSSADAVSKQFNFGTFVLTVTGGGTSTPTSNVTDTSDGLGVIGVGGNPLAGDNLSGPLDSAVNQSPTYANFLDLSFNQPVTLLGLTHSLFDATDDYGLMVDGSELAGPDDLTVANLDATTLANAAGRTGMTFRITTQSSGGINFPPIETDNFRVDHCHPRACIVRIVGAGWVRCVGQAASVIDSMNSRTYSRSVR